MIRILIADDHAIVREGLKQIITETPDMVVADEAETGNEVIQKALRNNYDIIVLDISMPGMNVIDVLKQLKRQIQDIRVLILSMHPEEQYAIRVLKAGASGYLTKESAPDDLIKAIRKVSRGEKYISTSLGEKLATALDVDYEQSLHETLSDREYQILCMLAAGKPIKRIAELLFISDKTVSTYRVRVLRKMDLKTNAELIRYAIKHQLVD
jgi:two-component system invasion response regulator UvrY